MRDFSLSLSRVPVAAMVIFFSTPVARSSARASRMRSGFRRKVTSMRGTPRGAGVMPSMRSRSRKVFSEAIVFLALVDREADGLLEIARGREDVLGFGRVGGVALDDHAELVVLQSDAEGEGGHVDDDRLFLAVACGQRVLDVAAERREHERLHGGAHRDHFLGGDVAVRGFVRVFP